MPLKLHRIAVTNFRNFLALDLLVQNNMVVVGENQSGKSNLLHALRLVLDTSLPDSARQLRVEDFCDAVPRPLSAVDRIEVLVEVSSFMEDPPLAAILSEGLIDPEKGIARLTYRFEPTPGLAGAPKTSADYTFRLFLGLEPENTIRFDDRRRLPLDVLPALRDAEGVLANWKTSPLRPLIEDLGAEIDPSLLDSVASQIEVATASLTADIHVAALADSISERLRRFAGDSYAPDTQLGFTPTRAGALLRSLRLFVEGRSRGLADTSLGTSNLIYLALRQLALSRVAEASERDHTFLAIEEPEAHLHPHLQRIVYREYLGSRTHAAAAPPEALEAPASGKSDKGASNIASRDPSLSRILTTHSPHIVSVAPVRSLVVLKRHPTTRISTGVSTAEVPLTPDEERDIERYLDVTRGELVFARSVLLVEGEAETYLLPAIALALGIDLDRAGVSVCSIGGVHFKPYLSFTGRKGIDIRTAVVTDGDPKEGQVDAGRLRASQLFDLASSSSAEAIACPPPADPTFLAIVNSRGLFVGTNTLEIDLYNAGQSVPILNAIRSLSDNGAARGRAEALLASPASMVPDTLLKDIEPIGKGRFAQHLAPRLLKSGFPEYLTKAIAFVGVGGL